MEGLKALTKLKSLRLSFSNWASSGKEAELYSLIELFKVYKDLKYLDILLLDNFDFEKYWKLFELWI